MIDISQQVLYFTLAGSVAVFTGFLVWIMYYIGQITRQSNDMIADFRTKMEELDESVQSIKEKVTDSVDNITAISDQVAYIVELVGGVTGKRKKTRRRKKRSTEDDE